MISQVLNFAVFAIWEKLRNTVIMLVVFYSDHACFGGVGGVGGIGPPVTALPVQFCVTFAFEYGQYLLIIWIDKILFRLCVPYSHLISRILNFAVFAIWEKLRNMGLYMNYWAKFNVAKYKNP